MMHLLVQPRTSPWDMSGQNAQFPPFPQINTFRRLLMPPQLMLTPVLALVASAAVLEPSLESLDTVIAVPQADTWSEI